MAHAEETVPSKASTHRILRFRNHDLDLKSYELRRMGRRVHLPRAAMEVLVLLIDRRGSLVTREEISSRLWTEPEMVDVVQGINTTVNRIRTALNDNSTHPLYIETVIGKGYRFIAEVVEVVPEPADAGGLQRAILSGAHPVAPVDVAIARPEVIPERPKRRAILLVLLGAAVMAALLGAGLRWNRDRNPTRRAPILEQVTTDVEEDPVTASALSPDGQWMAYANTDGILLRVLQGGAIHPLAAPANFRVQRIAWFADHLRLLVSGFHTSDLVPQLWAVSLTGDAPRLLRVEGENGVPSPDGTRIAFTTGQGAEIWLAGIAGEGAHPIVAPSSNAIFPFISWSADGRRIFYAQLRYPGEMRAAKTELIDEQYWTYGSVKADTGELVSSKQGMRFNSACQVGDKHLFFLNGVAADARHPYGLWEVDLDAASGAVVSVPRLVTSLQDQFAYGLSASEDGSKFGVVLERAQPDVYVGDLRQPGPALTNIQRLTYDSRADFPHAWLPGPLVLFESDRGGKFRLYKQRLDSRIAESIETGDGDAVLPQVSPDGQWILYRTSKVDSGRVAQRLVRVPVGGGVPAQVPLKEDPGEFQCPLLGKEGCVLRQRADSREYVFYALDPIQGKGRELGRTPWIPGILNDWGVSPDGSMAALPSHDPSHPKIRIVPLGQDSRHGEQEIPVHITGSLSSVAWAADGRGWYVSTRTDVDASLLFVNWRGETHLLRESPTSILWGVPSPDGRRMAFVDQTADRNVWIWRWP